MEENKNFEGNNEIPKMSKENIEQSHEQQLGKEIEKLEAGLTKLDSLKQEVGGDQGIKNTVAKMSPEEKQKIVDRIKAMIKEKMSDSKTWALAGGAVLFAVVLEYIGFRDLDASTPGGSPDWYNESAVVFMLAETAGAVAALGVAAKKAIETIGDRIRSWKANKQEVAAQLF